jgi:hypothetical protein
MEKFCIISYCFALTYQGVIVIFFWAAINNETPNIFGLSLHGIPLMLILIDFVFSTIQFDIRHLPLALFIQIIYFIVNLCLTFKNHNPIYPPLNWKDAKSWEYGIGLLVLESLQYVILHFFSRWKT